MKIWCDFFFETWSYAWKQKHIYFFLMFWRKSGILIPNVYFYDVKIQTNIKQNLVKKNKRRNHKFSKILF